MDDWLEPLGRALDEAAGPVDVFFRDDAVCELERRPDPSDAGAVRDGDRCAAERDGRQGA